MKNPFHSSITFLLRSESFKFLAQFKIGKMHRIRLPNPICSSCLKYSVKIIGILQCYSCDGCNKQSGVQIKHFNWFNHTHIIHNSQSEYFISAQHSYATLKCVYYIDSSSQSNKCFRVMVKVFFLSVQLWCCSSQSQIIN